MCLPWSLRAGTERGVYAASAWHNPCDVACIIGTMNCPSDVAQASSPASSPGVPPGVRAGGETPQQLAGGTPALQDGSWKASFRFCACIIGTMNCPSDVAQASSPASSPGVPPGVRAGGETPQQLAGGTPALQDGSWKASFRFCACIIGTMNCPSDVAQASSPASSPGVPPGVRAGGETPQQLAGGTPALQDGSWKASFRFCACIIGTMNCPSDVAQASSPASSPGVPPGVRAGGETPQQLAGGTPALQDGSWRGAYGSADGGV